MGTRQQMAICSDCEKKNINFGGEFYITLEWMDKADLIEYLKKVKCAWCDSDDWTLTDYSEI